MIASSWLDFGLSADVAQVTTVAFRLVLALVLGAAIAWIRADERARTTRARQALVFTLLLLPVLVAMTTLIVDDNVARAFGLVGALSIVRFRTIVEDTRDTVFIVFAVVAGMGAGAGNLAVCAVGVPLVGAVALLLRRRQRIGPSAVASMLLEVRVGLGHDVDAIVNGCLGPLGVATRLVGVSTARQGASADYRYEIAVSPEDARRVAEGLAARDGVQSVDLREP